MNSFKDNLKRLRLSRKLTQEELGNVIGVKKGSVSAYERGDRKPSFEVLENIADYFNINLGDLMGQDYPSSINNIIPIPKVTQIPLVGTIACGEPIVANREWDETVDLPEHVRADFALRAHGDSMINARIYDGDIVYIRQQSTVDDGDIAAVVIEDSATLKKVHFYEDHIVLQAENPQVRPLVYWESEMDNVHIIGKAVAFTSLLHK